MVIYIVPTLHTGGVGGAGGGGGYSGFQVTGMIELGQKSKQKILRTFNNTPKESIDQKSTPSRSLWVRDSLPQNIPRRISGSLCTAAPLLKKIGKDFLSDFFEGRSGCT